MSSSLQVATNQAHRAEIRWGGPEQGFMPRSRMAASLKSQDFRALAVHLEGILRQNTEKLLKQHAEHLKDHVKAVEAKLLNFVPPVLTHVPGSKAASASDSKSTARFCGAPTSCP